MITRLDHESDGVLRKDLDIRSTDPSTVSPEHQTESHHHGEPVQAGSRVEVVPGGQEFVAVQVEEGAEEDGGEDVGVLPQRRRR
jgi:hypothetical protein